jgi:hypothetical protein
MWTWEYNRFAVCVAVDKSNEQHTKISLFSATLYLVQLLSHSCCGSFHVLVPLFGWPYAARNDFLLQRFVILRLFLCWIPRTYESPDT